MNAIKSKLPGLVEEELAAANNTYPLFYSAHEGRSVIQEELEEATDELHKAWFSFCQLWANVKADAENHILFDRVDNIRTHAINAAAELIQVAAMCDKFKQSFK